MSDEERSSSTYSWKSDPFFWVYTILMLVPIVTVFVFYNYYSLVFLVYAGWVLMVFSILLILLAGSEFRKKGRAPKGKSIVNTTVVVDSGIYSVIRHPQYLGFILFVFALVLMSQHWISISSSILGSILFYRDVLREENMSIAKFGDRYKEYSRKVPRMNLIEGAIRLLDRNKEKNEILISKQ
jgi:protein-S-isoprenylcysteine O-methyltransferase Ste14